MSIGVSQVVEGVRFPCHKYILAAGSDYFRALLFNGMKESSELDVHLLDIEPAAFEHVLRFMCVTPPGVQNCHGASAARRDNLRGHAS